MRGLSRKLRDRRGGFLLEALLAVMILSVGLVGLVRALWTSLKAAKEAEAYAKAVIAAENALPEVIRLNGQKNGSLIDINTGENNLSGQIVLGLSADAGISPELSEAKVRIFWPGPVTNKEISATTFVYQPSDAK